MASIWQKIKEKLSSVPLHNGGSYRIDLVTDPALEARISKLETQVAALNGRLTVFQLDARGADPERIRELHEKLSKIVRDQYAEIVSAVQEAKSDLGSDDPSHPELQ